MPLPSVKTLAILVAISSLVAPLALAKRSGSAAEIRVDDSSKRVQSVKVGATLKTRLMLKATGNAETLSVTVHVVKGLELVSKEEVSWSPVAKGDEKSLELELKVTAASGQLLLTASAVNGKYVESEMKNLFFTLDAGVMTVAVEGQGTRPGPGPEPLQ